MTRLRAALALLLIAAGPAHAGFNWAGQVTTDAEGLASDDAKKRLDAVALLAADDIALAEPYLMKTVTTETEDKNVRHAAARALGLGQAQAAVPLMTDWLNDIDVKTKAVAAEVLGDIGGPAAAAALTRSLGDADAAVRQQAVKALGKIGRRGGSVVIALIPRLEDDKADVKRETIDQLEQLGDRRAVIPIVARFGDTSPDVRKAAVKAVGKLGDASAVPALVRIATGDSNLEVRAFAVGALGNLGAVDALDTLTELLKAGDAGFRDKVASALGQIAAAPGSGKAGEDAMRTLVQNLAVGTQSTSAMEALRLAGHAAVPALVAHLSGRLAGDPTKAVTLLAEIGDPRATTALAGELERGRVPTPLVLRALGATGDPAALVPVLGALSHKDAAIRFAAMEALRPLLGTDARAGDVLIEHLADEDLEVRILATEYLGILGVAAATPKLTVLAGPGNPQRLRLAAIDALGGIGGATRSPDAARALVDVLREGPADLHRAAATALAYIGDPTALPMLITLARADHGPTRYHLLRAIGRTLHAHPDPTARRLLHELAEDPNIRVALAAIGGLAAANDPAEAAGLREQAAHAASDRRRAAAWALGELHDAGAEDVLLAQLGGKDDRVVGDATWALGEIAAAAPTDARVAALAERWLYLGQHGGWATAIDATGALARVLWALPPAARAPLVAGDRRAELGKLAFHKSRLVRINAALALASLAAAGDADAQKSLALLVHDDGSPRVRAAALTGLLRGPASDALAAAQKSAAADVDPLVKSIAKAPVMAPRAEWRSFYIVDPTADDALVRQEPYFLHTADGLVWATYTDARGELTSEHVPPGDDVPQPQSREDEY